MTANAEDGGALSVLLGYGDGGFANWEPVASGFTPVSVSTGDFNQDGITDLVASNQYSESVSVILGLDDGGYLPPYRYRNEGAPVSVAVGDLTGSGTLDLCVVDLLGAVNTLLGFGDGGFVPQVSFWDSFFTAYAPTVAAIGDLNEDGIPDLAVANSGDTLVSILIGLGDGGFSKQTPDVAGDGPSSVVLADFDGDGHLDVAVVNAGEGTAAVLLGYGDGGFQSKVSFAVGPSGAGRRETPPSPSCYSRLQQRREARPWLKQNHDDQSVSVLLNACGTLPQ